MTKFDKSVPSSDLSDPPGRQTPTTDSTYRDAHDYRDSGMMGGPGAAAEQLADAHIDPARPDQGHGRAPHDDGRFGYRQLDPSLDPRDRRHDGQLREAIYGVLHDERGIDARSIEVQVHSGQVDLSGTVPEQAQLGRIQDRVRRMRGVLGVQNRLSVQPTPATAHPTNLPTDELTTGQHATGETATMGIPGSEMVDDETSEGVRIAENNRQ